ncbi:MAG: hypothetical protein GKS06_04515 [Acidobacteria bacterium]|nr:hypothetical protein [Acidobacteriota bacterium]
MAPTGSDEQTTELADPTNPESAESADSTPFGDWREQLRERVKEIRARKHAEHREDIDELALDTSHISEAAEKLDAVRAQTAAAEAEEEPQVQLVDRAREERRADIGDIVDDLVGAGAPATIEGALEERNEETHFADAEVANEPILEPVNSPQELDDLVSSAPDNDFEWTETEAPLPETEPEPARVDDVPEFELESAAADNDRLAPLDDVPLFQSEPEFVADESLETSVAEPIADTADEPSAESFAAEISDEPPVELFDDEHSADPLDAISEQLEQQLQTVDPSAPVDRLDAAVEDALEAIDNSMEEDAAEPTEEATESAEPELFGAPDDSVPAWARGEDADPTPPAVASATADEDGRDARLDSIPPELRDVEIPAWALPREPSRETAGDEPAEETAPDVHIVGEFTTPTSEKRTDLPATETPVPTAEMLDTSIGDLSALAENDVEIAPPGSLVDAADLGIELNVEDDDRALPGLFDATGEQEAEAPIDAAAPETDALAEAALSHIENATAEADASIDEIDLQISDDAVVDLDAISPPPPATSVTTENERFAAEAVPSEDSSKPEPASNAAVASTDAPEVGAPLAWDIDDDSEADAIADAKRQHADSSAPLSDRVYSALADGLVVLTMGIVLVVAGASAAGTAVVPFVQAAPLPFVLAWALFGLVYGVIFVGTSGQTLGKMAMRVRVIGADTFHVGYGRAALRGVAYAAAALPAGLGLLSAVRDPEHRALHDRLSSTRVVKA